jgi:hypothetical protein
MFFIPLKILHWTLVDPLSNLSGSGIPNRDSLSSILSLVYFQKEAGKKFCIEAAIWVSNIDLKPDLLELWKLLATDSVSKNWQTKRNPIKNIHQQNAQTIMKEHLS